MVLVGPFSKILESSRASKILIISPISSFKNIKVVVLESFFFLIPASIAEAAAVIPNGAKTFLLKELLLSLMDQLIYLIMTLKILQTELF